MAASFEGTARRLDVIGRWSVVVRVVERWAGLSRDELAEAVVAAVRKPPVDASRLWQAVRADPVMAAAVRGILSGLLREYEGSRDEVFWTYRVTTVRAVLNAPDSEPSPLRSTPQEPSATTTRIEDVGPGFTDPKTVASVGASENSAVSVVPPIEFRAQE
jgi:hypothetical protein